MAYIKNRIDKLKEWLEEAPRANASMPAQKRDERLQKLLAQHVEDNLQRGRTDTGCLFTPTLCRELNMDQHSPCNKKVVEALAVHYLREAGYNADVIRINANQSAVSYRIF